MRYFNVLRFVFIIFVCLAGAAPLQGMSAFEPIEIRLVAEEAENTSTHFAIGDGREIAVEPETLLGPADFASVGEVEWTDGKPGFNVALTAEGAKKYKEISAENVGRRLAIIVDGRILMTPKILDPVSAQGFLLTVNTETEAKKIAAKIRQSIAGPEK